MQAILTGFLRMGACWVDILRKRDGRCLANGRFIEAAEEKDVKARRVRKLLMFLNLMEWKRYLSTYRGSSCRSLQPGGVGD